MQEQIKDRTIRIARHMIDKDATMRELAEKFGISRSTVCLDLNRRLPHVDFHLYCQVRDVIDRHEQEKRKKGGEATKKVYAKRRLRRVV